MDAWTLRRLPKTPAGLMRGVQLDRRRQRLTPAVMTDHWTRYWRTTPLMLSPRARATPTTLGRHHSVTAAQHTAGYLSSSWARTSTISVTNIASLTSTGDAKKQSTETRKSTEDTGVLAAGTSDVTVSSNVTAMSSTSVPADSQSTTSKHLPSSSHVDAMTMSSRSDQQTSHDRDATWLADESSSRATDVTTLTSQPVATSGSRDDQASGVDVNAQAAEAEDEDVQSDFSGRVTAASTSPGDMTSTYVSDDGNSTDNGVATSVSEAIQVTSDRYTGEMSGEDVAVLSGGSEATNHGGGTSSTRRDETQVSAGTSTPGSDHLIFIATENSATTKNTTSASAISVDELSSSRESGSGAGVAWTASWRRVEVTGRRRGSTADKSRSSTTTLSSLTDDKLSLVPRRVLLKDANSTGNGSAVYWSSQMVIPLLTIAMILALILLVIVVACAARYARKYCCCLAPHVGSYTPSPSPSTQRRRHLGTDPASTNEQQARRVQRPRDATRAAPPLQARTEPAYRSVVMIGSERIGRRVVPTKQRAKPLWTVRQNGTWGNLSQVNNGTVPAPPLPPPPALPSQTIVLGGRRSRGEVDEAGRTVPEIVSLLEGRVNVSAPINDSRPKPHDN